MKKAVMIIAMAGLSMGVAAQKQSKSGIYLENMNQTVAPGDDFYEFATGGWQKLNPLPAAYSRYGAFDKLRESSDKRINTIISDLQKKSYKEGTIERKMADLYKLAMDSVRRNREGVQPVMPLLNEIESAKTKSDLMAIQLKYPFRSFGLPYRAGFGADEKNAKMNILSVSQGGLTLGQKDYYLENDKNTTEIRNAYKQHILKMFRLFGFDESQAEAKRDAIVKFETAIAAVSKSKVELRDPEANYNASTLQEFKTNYPNLPLEQMLNARGVKSELFQNIVIGQPSFLTAADKLFDVLSADDLRAIMQWRVINSSANFLSDEVREADFEFSGKIMSGRKEDYPSWKRATSQMQRVFGESLGKMYCERYFPESSKQKMKELVKNLQISLGERIQAQNWMSAETKKNAMEKLSTFYVKIGYPDKWEDMSGLVIDPAKSYIENMDAASEFLAKKRLAKTAGKPVDKDEWYMTPQTVNAYYNPTTNEICFPAGILQYPFFDPKADEAFNYGAIGVVIGHEMTHGFDDGGRKYDKDGNMKDWWTDSDNKMFVERTDKYADFFSKIKVLPDLNANGRLTLGENLADHGGLQVAFNAYKNATKGKTPKKMNGFTPDQRFFIAYAGVWGQNITEKGIRQLTKTDVHSLGEWRVNGALPHIDAWYDAFGITEKDKMFVPKSQRLDLW